MILGIVGGLVFFALIIASVLLHELGHLIPAKIFGVKATQYFAGFGPTIWSRRIGETEYGFKWLPFGGYVRLLGMYPPRREGAKDTWLQRVADDARSAEAEELEGTPDDRLFVNKPTWQKLVVMSSGILTNLLLAFLLFQGVFATAGHQVATTTVGSVAECVLPRDIERACAPDDPQTPAKAMGLQAGDRIVVWNGTEVRDWAHLQRLIRDNRDGEARVVVERAGARVELPATHTVINGVADTLDPSKIVEAGFVGFNPRWEVRKEGPVGTVSAMWDMSKQALYSLSILPVKVYNVVVDMVQGHPRDPNSPMSIVGASRAAGEVAGESRIGWGDKAAFGASLLGGLNLFLFWLNVVPLPPMDGGHIAGAVVEGVRRWWARLRGRPDPGHVDTAKMVPVAYAIGAAMLVMGLILIAADIISPVRIF